MARTITLPHLITFGSTVWPQGSNERWRNSDFRTVQKTSEQACGHLKMTAGEQKVSGVTVGTEDEHEHVVVLT